jgi:hypothetical protein
MFCIALAKHLSVIVQNVMLSGDKKDLFMGGFQDLIDGIELLGIGKVTYIASV